MKPRPRLLTAATLIALCLNGCSLLKPLPPTTKQHATDCRQLFEAMDNFVAEYGVGDAGAAKIAGFPGLRVDRFLASFSQENLTNEAYAAWIERLRKLDERARRAEWRNLPPEATAELRAAFGSNIEASMHVCGQVIAEGNLISEASRSQLLASIEPPEVYSTWQRVLGLYYLTRWAVVDGVKRLHREMREPFVNPRQMRSANQRWISYAPPKQEELDANGIAKILGHSAANPLGIPEPTDRELSRLFATFAPIWSVNTDSDDDRIGSVGFDTDGERRIDTEKPSVYRLPSYTRYGGLILLQLNYVIWFPARPATSWMDIYSGRFDGLIWRVTLGMDGKPLAYDSIHLCGCYHQIFPGEGLRTTQPSDGSESILSPMPIAAREPAERLTLHISSGKHFIVAIDSEKSPPKAIVYNWLDYDELLSLMIQPNRHLSFFDDDGLVKGSERLERFLLWPMGVPSAGAMRQWGTHAIAFVGRRHFDDPRLLEKLLRPLGD